MMFDFWNFYYDNPKNFYKGFDAIDNFYITFYRFDVSDHFDAGEHVGVWSSIQLCSGNLGGSCMKCVAFVST